MQSEIGHIEESAVGLLTELGHEGESLNRKSRPRFLVDPKRGVRLHLKLECRRWRTGMEANPGVRALGRTQACPLRTIPCRETLEMGGRLLETVVP